MEKSAHGFSPKTSLCRVVVFLAALIGVGCGPKPSGLPPSEWVLPPLANQQPAVDAETVDRESPPQPTRPPAEPVLADQLRQRVTVLVEEIGERNISRAFAGLQKSANYIERSFKDMGFKPVNHQYTCDGHQVRNIVATLEGSAQADEIVVIGAHYDSAIGTPGANDNASGVAALLELARLMKDDRPRRTLRFVAFVNEERPTFTPTTWGACATRAIVGRTKTTSSPCSPWT